MEPLESVLCGCRLPSSGPKRGHPWGSRVDWPLVGTRVTHMVLDARWAENLLVVLHLRPSRLAIIVSPWEFGPALTSYHTHCRTSNFPTDDANYRVTVFGLSPLQWICREWVQKLGSDEATTCFGDEKHTESGGPTSQGEGTSRSRMGMRQPLSVTHEPPSCL